MTETPEQDCQLISPQDLQRPIEITREWITTLHRELRRHELCLEQLRAKCAQRGETAAELRSDLRHHKEDAARLEGALSTGVSEFQTALAAAQQSVDERFVEVNDKIVDMKSKMLVSQVKVGVIWVCAAAVGSSILTLCGELLAKTIFG